MKNYRFILNNMQFNNMLDLDTSVSLFEKQTVVRVENLRK